MCLCMCEMYVCVSVYVVMWLCAYVCVFECLTRAHGNVALLSCKKNNIEDVLYHKKTLKKKPEATMRNVRIELTTSRL